MRFTRMAIYFALALIVAGICLYTLLYYSPVARDLALRGLLITPLGKAQSLYTYKLAKRRQISFQLRQDQNAPECSVVFFGASQIQGLLVSAITCPALNFGIGGDTTEGLLERLPRYVSPQSARAIVLNIGGNDLRDLSVERAASSFDKVLGMLPPKVPLLVLAILPVDETEPRLGWPSNAKIKLLNQRLAAFCARRVGCVFLDAATGVTDKNGMLKKSLHTGDGLHLNKTGRSIWKGLIKKALERMDCPACPRKRQWSAE